MTAVVAEVGHCSEGPGLAKLPNLVINGAERVSVADPDPVQRRRLMWRLPAG
ncbi:MAG: hypothetical protein M3Z25_09955 [Actinomycetota bacterium]|nr:hypothetical protein [Actinomycetota bacterium]